MVARSFSSEEYQNMQKDSLTLETRDADEISRLIEKKLEEYESVPDNEIQAVEFSCQPVRLKENYHSENEMLCQPCWCRQ